MFLIIGPCGAGKTLLLKRMQGNYSSISKDDVPPTIGTVGTNLMTINTVKKTEVTVREMGGAMSPIWHSYYKDSHAIIFMLDVSRSSQISIACVQLLSLLAHPNTQGIPLLILLNKRDCMSAMNQVEVENFLRVDDLLQQASQKIKVLEISARTGQNLDKVAKWIYSYHRAEDIASS